MSTKLKTTTKLFFVEHRGFSFISNLTSTIQLYSALIFHEYLKFAPDWRKQYCGGGLNKENQWWWSVCLQHYSPDSESVNNTHYTAISQCQAAAQQDLMNTPPSLSAVNHNHYNAACTTLKITSGYNMLHQQPPFQYNYSHSAWFSQFVYWFISWLCY